MRVRHAALLAILLAGLWSCRSVQDATPDARAEIAKVSSAQSRQGVADALGVSEATLEAALTHGPWPVRFRPDPGNRASGHPAAIELGRRLFDDPRLSADGQRTCASCHRADLGFADGRARSPAAHGGPLDRNAQGLLDVRLQHWFGWDGAADSLWAFVMRPLADAQEMGASTASLEQLFAQDAHLACLRRAAFGAPDSNARVEGPGRQSVRVEIAKSLAAYLETLDSPRSRFDDFRDALDRGDIEAAKTYPANAVRGLTLFTGAGRCNLCHLGPAFSNGEFHDIGRPHFAANARPDPGRHGGIKSVLIDPYNRLGAWSDAPATPQSVDSRADAAVRTRHLQAHHRNFGEFRVPGLRGAASTAPYFHDGSAPNLAAVVAHYSDIDLERLHADGESLLRPLGLDARARADLLAFLETLSQPSPIQPAPAPAPGAGRKELIHSHACTIARSAPSSTPP